MQDLIYLFVFFKRLNSAYLDPPLVEIVGCLECAPVTAALGCVG